MVVVVIPRDAFSMLSFLGKNKKNTQPVQNHKKITRTSRLCFHFFPGLAAVPSVLHNQSHENTLNFLSLFINRCRFFSFFKKTVWFIWSQIAQFASDTGLINKSHTTQRIPHLLGRVFNNISSCWVEIFAAGNSQKQPLSSYCRKEIAQISVFS